MKKIAIWVGSSPAPRKLFKEGLKKLQLDERSTLVLKEVKRMACRADNPRLPFVAGTDLIKAKTFQKLWNNPKVSIIFGVRGGYGTLRLLPLLDRLKLASQHKWLWGFSDFTILQHYLWQRFQSPWVHGPFLTSQAFLRPTKTEIPFWDKSECDLTIPLKGLHISRSLPQRALLLGGNLACLTAMIGTPWEPKPLTPYYLFLEDINEMPYRVDRLLMQLSHSQMFRHCHALLLGHFSQKSDVLKVFLEFCTQTKMALFDGMPAGHDRPNCPILMGQKVKLLTQKNSKVAHLNLPKPIFQ